MRNRTLTVRVAEVIEGGSKSEFYSDLRTSLDWSRRMFNSAISICCQRDSELMKGGKAGRLYVYPDLKDQAEGCAQALASITRDAEKEYLRRRGLVRSGYGSFPIQRSYPWPLLPSKTDVEDHRDFLAVRVRLKGQFWRIRLAGGANHRRQISGIRKAISEGKVCQSRIRIDRGVAVIDLSVQLPEMPRKANGEMVIKSTKDKLLVCTKPQGKVPFVITGDSAREWMRERDRLQKRCRQDMKSERRYVAKQKLKQLSFKFNCRIKSYIHEQTSHVVKHAVRRGVGRVYLDLTVKSYEPGFRWFELGQMLRYKFADAGIEVVEQTMAIESPDVCQPHVYFKMSPETRKVKIGETGKSDGSRHRVPTDSPDRDLVILAIENVKGARSKRIAREKHYHAMFADFNVDRHRPERERGEWFEQGPVIEYLREVGWIGNAGNLSQIQQYMPETMVSGEASSSAERESGCLLGK
ncbi:hypothetical protein [Roseiconus lacunae]|uniref:Transposase n=1 Tax=Roseiconus lacunae TaxID=2605694 RepID=A0ABT7PEL0_9BACT|nr:hypothetical protein [Roseiconus lacunae]MDM4014940.1 hypothetical protein [Roseiconus lacunae]